MAGRIEGKVALVTGGTGGIGNAVVERFHREGAKAVYAADLAGDAVMDVTDPDSVAALFQRIADEEGRLDVLVNCAGIEIEETIENTSEEQWARMIAINLTGTFRTCRAALPLMRKAGGGSIVNFGSYDGFMADPELAAYCASKGGVHALTKAIAVDHGPEGIRCNAVCPGYIETPMLQSFFGAAGDIESLKEEVRRVHPVRRWGQPEDVANLVLWLASDEAGYASGQLWVLDGGLTAQAQQMRL